MKRFVLLLVTVLFSALALAAVNINTANLADLEALPEIGPVTSSVLSDRSSECGAIVRGHRIGQR